MTTNDYISAADRLRAGEGHDAAIRDRLRTSDRVLARISDGIYRQPASAVRELLANAFDADATWVTVKTDAPRFTRISVEDNGNGMTPEALMHMLYNIGGSAKRSDVGTELLVTSTTDTERSPGGRELIGKLGIGLFSVAQLTRSFTVITKVQGDDFRSVAQITLRQFSEPTDGNKSDLHETGDFVVWREGTSDEDSHGTTIELTSIRPQTRDTLGSVPLWNRVDAVDPSTLEIGSRRVREPKFHIGRMGEGGTMHPSVEGGPQRLPWDEGASPEARFESMVDAVWQHARFQRETAKIEEIFDYYLGMLWQLALWLPLPYVKADPFDIAIDHAGVDTYWISNDIERGVAEPVSEGDRDRVLTLLTQLGRPRDGHNFSVTVDGVELRRPLVFSDLPTGSHALKRPIMLVGGLTEPFESIDASVSGGPLRFYAYLFWNPVIAPVEHRGVLVRIHDASGTRFDSTFMDYQVSELTRLRQIECEIFVTEGLEGALNIDRESFNTAHSHSVVVARWLHSALRQLATAQKREAQAVRREKRELAVQASGATLDRIVQRAREKAEAEESAAPRIVVTSKPTVQDANTDYVTTYRASDLLQAAEAEAHGTSPATEAKLAAIVEVLEAYELLHGMREEDRRVLFGLLLEILGAD